jgi:hypothetical protein
LVLLQRTCTPLIHARAGRTQGFAAERKFTRSAMIESAMPSAETPAVRANSMLSKFDKL